MNEDNGSNSSGQNQGEPDASSTTQKIALWLPAWHELDQTVVIGLRQRYYFFEQTPEYYAEHLENSPHVDYLFFNGFDESVNSQIRMAKVVQMHHAQLGDLLRIDTMGLDYIIYPMDGEEVVVDAEEAPGTVRSGTAGPVDDWKIQITLQEISEPIEQDVC